MPLQIRHESGDKYYFLTKSGHRVDLEHKNNEPNIGLGKWRRECFLDFPIKVGKFAKYEKEVNELIWENDGFKVRLYPVDTRTLTEVIAGEERSFIQNEDGGLEWEITLKKKPSKNSFSVPINTQNLKFYYQPPLYEEYNFSQPFANDTLEVNATHVRECVNGTWRTTTYRPENVVGSYVVYHATRTNMHRSKDDAEKYKCGKAFHIYRPLARDSAGNEVWCDLNIDEAKGLLTVTIPQEFLDKALYPVMIDPTFGYETIGASSVGLIADSMQGTGHQSPGETGTATSMTIYKAQSIGKWMLILYRESDQALMGYTEEGEVVSEGWHTLNIVSGGDLENIDYILTDWRNKGATLWYDSLDDYYYHASETYTGSPPDPASMSTLLKRSYSIYCTYTAAAKTQSVSETLTFTESIATQIPVLKTKEIAEALTYTESIIPFLQLPRDITETLTLYLPVLYYERTIPLTIKEVVSYSESLLKAFAPLQTLSETLTLSELTLPYLRLTRYITETHAFTEQLTSAFSVLQTLSETTTHTQSLLAAFSRLAEISESLTSTETLLKYLTLPRDVSETLTFTEYFWSTIAVVQEIIETTTFNEVVTRYWLGYRPIAETISYSESLVSAFSLVKVLPETLLFTEEITTQVTIPYKEQNIYQTTTFTESFLRYLTLPREISETLTSTEYFWSTVALIQEISETITFFEILYPYWLGYKTITETTTLSESLLSAFAVLETITETLEFNEQILKYLTSTRLLPTETITYSESILATKLFLKQIYETIAYNEALLKYIVKIKELWETILYTEYSIPAFSRLAEAYETLTHTELLLKYLYMPREIYETLTFTEEVAKIVPRIQELYETLTLTEQMLKYLVLTRLFPTETTTYSESILKAFSFIKQISETTLYTEATISVLSYLRYVSETLTYTESILATRLFLKEIYETTTFTEELATILVTLKIKQLYETATFTELLVPYLKRVKPIAETLTFTEYTLKQITKAVEITETVTFTEDFWSQAIVITTQEITETITFTQQLLPYLLQIRVITETVVFTEAISLIPPAKIQDLYETLTFAQTILPTLTRIMELTETLTYTKDFAYEVTIALLTVAEFRTRMSSLERKLYGWSVSKYLESLLNP